MGEFHPSDGSERASGRHGEPNSTNPGTSDAITIPRVSTPTTETALTPRISGAGGRLTTLDLPLAFYWFQLRRHLREIAAVVALASTLAWLAALRIPKQYESTATLRVDPENTDNLFDPARQRNGSSTDDEEVLMATEMSDVTSHAVVVEAVRNAHLDALAEFSAERSTSHTPLSVAALDAIVADIQTSARVTRPEQTRNIEIHFRSYDPQSAAEVANALAAALINHEYTTRLAALTNASKWMVRQLDDLRAKVEAGDRTLVEYQRTNSVLIPDDRQSAINQRLLLLNTQLGEAQTERVKAEADEDLTRSGDLDALLATEKGSALAVVYERFKAAQASFDQIKQHAGTANPVYIRAVNDVTEAARGLLEAKQHLVTQINANYQRAVARERLLEHEFDSTQSQVASLNAKAIGFEMLKRDAESNKRLYDDLLQRIKEANISAGFRSQQLRISDPAVANPVPVYPNIRAIVAFVALLSTLAGCAIAIGAALADRTVTSSEDVETLLGVPLLGTLPHVVIERELTELSRFPDIGDGVAAKRSSFAESVLLLHTALQFSPETRARVICITSALPEEGKSIAILNLAVAMALHGSRVLVIDADIRRPSLHRLFGRSNRIGLSNALRQQVTAEECLIQVGVGDMWMMAAGPNVSNPSELLSLSLPELLEHLKPEYDCILLDSPPLLGFADALVLSALVDSTIVVVRAGMTHREQVLAAIRQLHRIRVRIQGVILNDVDSADDPYLVYDYRHYSETYEADKAQRTRVG